MRHAGGHTMKGVADRTPELMNEYQAHTKSYQSFQHFLVVKIEELEDEIALKADYIKRLEERNDDETQ